MMRGTRPPRRRLRTVLLVCVLLCIGAYFFSTSTRSANRKPLQPNTIRTVEDEAAYLQSKKYWSKTAASEDGVMAGYARISPLDTQTTLAFIRKLMNLPDGEPTERLVAIDCGAGIGRVTKGALVHAFTEIDVLEQSEQFLEEAKKSLADAKPKVNFILEGMHEFVFPLERYDLVLINWSGGYLTDDDLVDFLARAKSGLRPGGFLVYKDNVSSSRFVDGRDKQRVRLDEELKAFFAKAGFKLLLEEYQEGFPSEILPVKMYGLRPGRDGEDVSVPEVPVPEPPRDLGS